ncbi:MAG: hypothetical protein GY788_19570 [bacterium]|nr:hypothetical protein [bacterium]
MDIPCVRFDDLSPGGSGSFGLLEPSGVIVANRIDGVVPALAAAEKAARDGNWVAGFVAYEAAPAFDDLLSVRPAGLRDPMRELPLLHFQVFGRRIELEDVDSLHFPNAAYNVSAWTADSTHHEYKEDLAKIGRAIMAGEISQLKHTFRLHAAFSGDPAALYRDLLMSQRGDHAACLDVGRFRLVSASPEGFFRRLGDRLTVKPVLASMRRGRWLGEDMHLASLLRSETEDGFASRMVVRELAAELGELGGPVESPTEERFAVERFETLWHLSAEISTELRPDIGIVDIFKALFPPVSVTGVPKPEAMELITRTEDTPRGAYCGVIGFIGPEHDGKPQAGFNVAVRTVVIDEDEGVAEFGVGTAITNRSDVVSAYEEARLKAKVLVDRRPDFRLFEHVRIDDGAARHRESKIARLVASARYFGFEVVESDIRDAIDKAAEAESASRVSVLLDREGALQTHTTSAPAWFDTPDSPYVLIGAIARHPVSSDNVFLYHNTTDTRISDFLARQYPDADVVILANQNEEIAGSLDGNIAVWIDDQWSTPPVSCGTVGCSFRAELIDRGEISERFITRAELEAAERTALIDDIHGWRLVGLVG